MSEVPAGELPVQFVTVSAEKWLPVISGYCAGCSACVNACPHDALALDWDFATLVRPERCSSEGACVTACPHDKAIRMAWVPATGDQGRGRWRSVPEAPLPRRWERLSPWRTTPPR